MNACILVVDDDPEIVGAIAITLEREGYRVLRAYDGMEALDLALDPAVRLILIDVMMPKLARAVRSAADPGKAEPAGDRPLRQK